MDSNVEIIQAIFNKHPNCKRDIFIFEDSLDFMLDTDKKLCFAVGWILGKKDSHA